MIINSDNNSTFIWSKMWWTNTLSTYPDTTFKCNSSVYAVRLWKDKNYFSLTIFLTKTIDLDNDINVATTYSPPQQILSHLQNRHIIGCWWSPIDSTSAWWCKWSGPRSRSWPSPEKNGTFIHFWKHFINRVFWLLMSFPSQNLEWHNSKLPYPLHS